MSVGPKRAGTPGKTQDSSTEGAPEMRLIKEVGGTQSCGSIRGLPKGAWFGGEGLIMQRQVYVGGLLL